MWGSGLGGGLPEEIRRKKEGPMEALIIFKLRAVSVWKGGGRRNTESQRLWTMEQHAMPPYTTKKRGWSDEGCVWVGWEEGGGGGDSWEGGHLVQARCPPQTVPSPPTPDPGGTVCEAAFVS